MVELNFSPTINEKSLFNKAFFVPAGKAEWLDFANNINTQVLGPEYNLSINIISITEIQKLNQEWRNKNSPTDILSFPYHDLEGELFLCPEVIIDRHQKYNRDIGNFVWFLIIHGLHHLKGFDHGREMETLEKYVRKKFQI